MTWNFWFIWRHYINFYLEISSFLALFLFLKLNKIVSFFTEQHGFTNRNLFKVSELSLPSIGVALQRWGEITLNVWLKWKIKLDPGKWHIFWRFGPYWLQKYPFRQDRLKIRRWWAIFPRHLPYLLILHKYFSQSCNSLVILCLFDTVIAKIPIFGFSVTDRKNRKNRSVLGRFSVSKEKKSFEIFISNFKLGILCYNL